MICVSHINKSFEDIQALRDVTVDIDRGCVFGLLGTNGAGKSTLMRLIAGVLRPNSGQVTLDDLPVLGSPEAKSRLVYLSDEQYFFPNTTPSQLEAFYARNYPAFDKGAFRQLLDRFHLDPKRKVNTFSKGMKKQLGLFLALSCNTPYLLCDETFDGLDPVVRQAVKSLFAAAMAERGLTTVIASHSLRELEDICDHIGLLHQGGLLLSRDLEDLRLGVHKVQAVFPKTVTAQELAPLELVSAKQTGRLQNLVLRGRREEVESKLRSLDPVFMELLPLTLEEVFITETEVAGYVFHDLAL